ncbi:hypothetical protein LY76DRAFT_609208 [Colletotrichum caudatum]|nr:hypothetical protein LY76DRAFT_609208 [Colletotrichum caudatum]
MTQPWLIFVPVGKDQALEWLCVPIDVADPVNLEGRHILLLPEVISINYGVSQFSVSLPLLNGIHNRMYDPTRGMVIQLPEPTTTASGPGIPLVHILFKSNTSDPESPLYPTPSNEVQTKINCILITSPKALLEFIKSVVTAAPCVDELSGRKQGPSIVEGDDAMCGKLFADSECAC